MRRCDRPANFLPKFTEVDLSKCCFYKEGSTVNNRAFHPGIKHGHTHVPQYMALIGKKYIIGYFDFPWYGLVFCPAYGNGVRYDLDPSKGWPKHMKIKRLWEVRP